MGVLSNDTEQQLVKEIKELLAEKMKKNHTSNLMNKKEVCKYLNISNNTFDKYMYHVLPFIQIGSSRRWEKNEVLEYLMKHASVVGK
ncbi:MAG: helix-turn-helix domain-containing protein [Streptococcaceae bacterium]|nr:helix-turn-helix domain-containing protein [Streptococcaceae bacterium]